MEVNVFTVTLQIINFLLFAFVIVKFCAAPIMRIIDQRREAIDEDLAAAREATRRAKGYEAEYEEKIQSAGEQSDEIIRTAVSQAEDMKKEILEEARLSAQKIKDRATDEIELMKKSASRELASHTGELAVSIASKLLQDSLDSETHKKIVMNFAHRVGSRNVN